MSDYIYTDFTKTNATPTLMTIEGTKFPKGFVPLFVIISHELVFMMLSYYNNIPTHTNNE